MPAPGIPQNLAVSQGNRAIALQWSLTATATSYDIQRSTDGVSFSSLGTSSLPSYLDTTPTVGVMYWYKIAGINGSGTGTYTAAQQMVAAPTGEMSLYEIRLRSKQNADRVNSNFVRNAEWDSFIGLAMDELYDMLITVYEDYFKAPNATFLTSNATSIFPLPDGATSFFGDDNTPFIAKPFYKLLGVDLALNTAQNAWVTMSKYMLIKRNQYLYPNSNSTIYGWQNAQYRVLGNNIEFIPVPAGSQRIRLLYIPRLQQLMLDTDVSTIGFSGWLRYVIVRAAKYALDKEESDSSKQDAEIMALQTRINASADNRDVGQPDSISNTRDTTGYGAGGGGFPGSLGGW